MSIVATESDHPIASKERLVNYFESCAKPKSEWKIGCEHEKFAFHLATLKPATYSEPQGLRDLLIKLQEDYGWKPIYENKNIIGLTRGQTSITFEPGGQIELAGAPLTTLHETAAENDQHLFEICEVGEKLGLGFLGMGFHPTARREDISLVPKERYFIQNQEMPRHGSLALDMMLRTCTVQVNLDYASELDMIKKFRVSLALQPIATALFASSPFKEGKPSGYNSYRMHVWTDVDPVRCGAPSFVFEDGFGFERYVDYALDVPMQFVYRHGHHINAYGQSFRDFMKGKLPALPGAIPTLTDWANHLTTLFPDVRLKKIIEMRGADSGDAEIMLALPAFWVGLLYDETSCDEAWQLVKSWTQDERNQLHEDVTKFGMQAQVGNQKVVDLAQLVLQISQRGLRRRANRLHGGPDESRYLDILFNFTESGSNRSDQLLMEFEHYQDFSMQKVFDTCRLRPPPKADDDF